MTQEEIIRSPLGREQLVALAREAGLGEPVNHDQWDADLPRLERFAALVAAHEREACAKACDEWNWSSKHGSNPSGQLAVLAAAIRNRSNK